MNFIKYNRQKLIQAYTHGFTIIEILLAVAISSIVVGAAGYGMVYMVKKNQISEAQSVRRIELNRALDFIAEDIKQATTVRGGNSDRSLIITLPNNDEIEYYYEDRNSSTSVWSGPGVILRRVNGGTPEVLVDGIAKSGFTLPVCEGGEDLIGWRIGDPPVADGGFFTCINDTFRTANLFLYGRLNVDNKATLTDNDILLVSTKFVTRNVPPEGRCTIPNLADGTMDAGQARSRWAASGFTAGNLTDISSSGQKITIQDLNPGRLVDCATTKITVGDNGDKCTVPNYVGGTIATAYSNWQGGNFTGEFAADAFAIAEGTDLSTVNVNVQEQRVLPEDAAPGSTVICSSSIKVSEKTCPVPDFEGDSSSTAQATWNSAGFSGTVTFEARNPGSAFTIQTQSLEKGKYVYCSAPVTLGEKKCIVPDFIGQELTETQRNQIWANNGFTTPPTLAYNNTGNDKITGQSLPAGTEQFCEGTAINLYEEQTCTINVANLNDIFINKTVTQASAAWTSYGFYPGTFNQSDLTDSTVIRSYQFATPPSGSSGSYQLECGTVVSVDDQALCTVPNMVGDLLPAATTKWTSAGFNADQLNAEGFSTGITVRTQSLTAGSQTICHVPVTLIGDACTVPSLTGLTATTTAQAWTNAGFTGSNLQSVWDNGKSTVTDLTNSVWNGYTTFSQTPAQGSVAACNSIGKVFNEAPYGVNASISDVIKSGSNYQYTIDLSWLFPKTTGSSDAGSFYVFSCDATIPAGNGSTFCEPTVDRSSGTTIINNAIPFNGNSTVTSKTARHIFSSSIVDGTRRTCYAVIARNLGADSFTPQSSVSSSNVTTACFTHEIVATPSNFIAARLSGGGDQPHLPKLSWNSVPRADKYDIYRCQTATNVNPDISPCTPTTKITTVTSTSYDVPNNQGPANNTAVCFRVKAVNTATGVESGFTNIACGSRR